MAVTQRGALTEEQRLWLVVAAKLAKEKQAEYRFAVLSVLADGASFAEVSKATGLSTNTLQRWKREAQS